MFPANEFPGFQETESSLQQTAPSAKESDVLYFYAKRLRDDVKGDFHESCIDRGSLSTFRETLELGM
jgi:hypothetical protein